MSHSKRGGILFFCKTLPPGFGESGHNITVTLRKVIFYENRYYRSRRNGMPVRMPSVG